MPFCPTEPCPRCWCCLEIACRETRGGCHEDPEAKNYEPDEPVTASDELLAGRRREGL